MATAAAAKASRNATSHSLKLLNNYHNSLTLSNAVGELSSRWILKKNIQVWKDKRNPSSYVHVVAPQVIVGKEMIQKQCAAREKLLFC